MIGFITGCFTLLLGIGLLEANDRVESSSRGFGADSCTLDSRDASLGVLGFGMGVFRRVGFGRFLLTPVMLLRFAWSLFVNNCPRN